MSGFIMWAVVSILMIVFILTMVKDTILKIPLVIICLVPPLSFIVGLLLGLFWLISIFDTDISVFNRSKSYNRNIEKKRQNSILEKARSERGNMFDKTPLAKLASNILDSKEFPHYSASLVGSIEIMFIDLIKDSYDIEFYEYACNGINKFEIKKHITQRSLTPIIKEIQSLLDIQLAWLKEMEDKDNQLDNIAYMERNNKRLEIIKSMADDVNKLYGKDAKEVAR